MADSVGPLFDLGVSPPGGLVPGVGRGLNAVRIRRAAALEISLGASPPYRGVVDRVGGDLHRVLVTLLLNPHVPGIEILEPLCGGTGGVFLSRLIGGQRL